MSRPEARDKAYALIDGERAYQDAQAKGDATHNPRWEHGSKPTVEGEILTLEDYMMDMRRAWTRNKGSEAAMDVMRKIAGIATRAIENHGAPPRK